MGKKATRNDPGALMPSFKADAEGIEIVAAPYRPSHARDVDLVLDAVDAEDYDIAYVKLPRLLDKYPLDFDLINSYMLALNEIDGGMAALTFFEGKLQRFYKYLSERAAKIAVSKSPRQCPFPGKFLGNKPFLRALYNSGLYLVFEGREAEAIDRFLQLLEHDPATGYEARTFVLHLAIESGRIDDLPKMAHMDVPRPGTCDPNGPATATTVADRGIGMEFGWGLYFFLTGNPTEARRWFEAGIRQNPHVVKFMFQGMQPEDEDTVNYSFATGTYTPGEESEAIGYIEAWAEMWHQNPDALGFLRETSLALGAHDERLFHLRVTLRHVVPIVSRLVAINSTSTFQDLARVVWESLGWSGTRKHGFVVTARTSPSRSTLLADPLKELLAEESFTIGTYDPETDDGIEDEDLDEDLDEGAIVDAIKVTSGTGTGTGTGKEGIDDAPGEDDEDNDDDYDAGEGEGDAGAPEDAFQEPDYFEDEVTLYEMFMKEAARAVFTYDYDAYWEFDIVVDRVLPRDAGSREAIVLESRGPVPAEDAGGPTSHMRALLEGKAGDLSTEALKDLGVQYEKLLAGEVEQARKKRERLERAMKESMDQHQKRTKHDDGSGADAGGDGNGST